MGLGWVIEEGIEVVAKWRQPAERAMGFLGIIPVADAPRDSAEAASSLSRRRMATARG